MAVLETYPSHVTWLQTARLINDMSDDVQHDTVSVLSVGSSTRVQDLIM